jgi:small subunit ribosomal protein S16
MSLKIRLSRGGSKKRPFYRLVVAENTSPRDGRFVERLGSYNPLLPRENNNRFIVNVERIKYWMSVGAMLTERAKRLLSEIGVIEGHSVHETPKKSTPKKKALERIKAMEAAKGA